MAPAPYGIGFLSFFLSFQTADRNSTQHEIDTTTSWLRLGPTVFLLTLGRPARTPRYRYFCPDVLNHIFILDLEADDLEIFAVGEGRAGLDKVKAGTLPRDLRPQNRNFREETATA